LGEIFGSLAERTPRLAVFSELQKLVTSRTERIGCVSAIDVNHPSANLIRNLVIGYVLVYQERSAAPLTRPGVFVLINRDTTAAVCTFSFNKFHGLFLAVSARTSVLNRDSVPHVHGKSEFRLARADRVCFFSQKTHWQQAGIGTPGQCEIIHKP
jgi:hypothetical protein